MRLCLQDRGGLSTPKGSSPMYRDFGLDQSFKPLPVAKVMLRVAVKEAIEDWEPRASLVGMDLPGTPQTPPPCARWLRWRFWGNRERLG